MKRLIALAAATVVAAPMAFAQTTTVVEVEMDESMTMMQERLSDALADCSIEITDERMMELTIAEVSGIIIAGSSTETQSDKCQSMEAFVTE